jgi:hypothetical protein
MSDYLGSVSSTILGGGIALLAVYLTNRFDSEKRRRQMLLDRGEELYALNVKWLNGFFAYYLRRSSVMQGKLTYNQALDLEIADLSKNTHDFSRIEMLIDVYFPSTRSAYDRLAAGRDALNEIASQHKRAYEAGDLDGGAFYGPFLQAIQEIEEAGKSLKEEIIKGLRSI